MRTAYNMIIYEALDFTVGLFDRDGNTISIGLGLPMFMRGMSDTVKAQIAHFGIDRIEEGDILLTNDAYVTGSHLNHPTFTLPILQDGEIVAFATCMAHWMDIGETLGRLTTDIYSEGLQIPMTKYHRRGELNEDVLNFIRMNVRRPDRAIGDLEAQLSSIRAGSKHVRAMLGRYGTETFLASIEKIKDQSEARARAVISAIPDGVYEAETAMDDDGIDLDKPVPIKVRVEIRGEEMTVDLSGVSPQVKGPFNSGAGEACAQVAFKCLALSQDFPINDGGYRALKVIVPPGTVVSATKPAAMKMWMCYPMTIIDTIFKALSQAIPERVIAGHHADLMTCNVNGMHPVENNQFLYMGGLIGGGWGAKYDSDGMSGTIAINDGDTHNGPTEQVENKYPVLVERYALRQDSGGAGRFRGGLGTEQVVVAAVGLNGITRSDHVRNPPDGLLGGLPGHGNQIAVRRANGEEIVYSHGKVVMQLEPGDAYILRSGGGGGFGNPTERDPARIREDLRQGYISPEAAARDYDFVAE
ncbi:MAG: hydantoinase B/oxoprolinase family protein, partial [Devosia sp.]|nr:hydantoinase B/oxoprolinase family protein [Devosia sp.]